MTGLANHRAGLCLMPKDYSRMPSLSATKNFFTPSYIDCRQYLGPTEDQGTKPWCAAYAASNWAESILWRVNDNYEQIQAQWIYEFAKKNDGMPDEDGTTLTAVLDALRGSVFDRELCTVKVIRPSRLNIKYALHKFGTVLGGFNITESWYACDSSNPVINDNSSTFLGGHAVVVCGYDKNHVYFQNSWGAREFGEYGFGKLTWAAFDRQFMYGAVLSNALDGLTISA